MSSWFDYLAQKTAPKAAHKRSPPAPAKLKGMALSDRVTELPKDEGIHVEESAASDSMIMRTIGKIRGG